MSTTSWSTGYGEALALTTEPDEPGVWFIAASNSNEAIFHWNAQTKQLDTFPFGTAAHPLPFGDQASLAIDSGGTVWAGVHDTLIKLDPSSGAMEQILIPTLPTDTALADGPGGGPGQPPGLFATHNITAVVAEPRGNIAISVTFSSTVLIYDPDTGAFSQVALPSADIPSAMGVSASGTLVIAASPNSGSDSIITVRQDGSLQTTPAQFSGFACGDSECASVQGPHGVQILQTQAATGSTPSQTSAFIEHAITVPSSDLQLGKSPALLNTGRLLAATTSGFDLIDPSSGSVRNLSLTDEPCTSGLVSNGEGPVQGSGVCQESASDFAVDDDGNAWFTTNGGTGVIYELTLGV